MAGQMARDGQGHFRISQRGVEYVDDSDSDNPPKVTWVCSPLHVVAKTRDLNSEEWGRLLEWSDEDGVKHQWAMPMEMLQGESTDVRRQLVRLGLTISTRKSARDLLTEYIQVWKVKDRARCVECLGWHDQVYVTPSATIGGSGEIVVFQNSHAVEPALSIAGDVNGWKENVSKVAIGNSRLVFALSTSFAGPLVHIVNEESGGFHFRGGSSGGKSTMLKAAASVWGHPKSYPRLWRATSNGLEGLAALHNDGLLILDELGQLDPSDAGEAAYLLANGQGKARASRTGAARRSARWRLLFLSAGEVSLGGLMARAGRTTYAGQEIRLADIDADGGAGMGAFENLGHHPTPAAFALSLKDASSRFHGAVGAEWLEKIVAERLSMVTLLEKQIRAFVEDVAPADSSGQVLRVARRFGLVASAGELASEIGLTGWPNGEAMCAARKCFNSWLLSFGGTDNREERTLLTEVRTFIESHGASRFEDMLATTDQRIPNRAGFFKTEPSGARQYIVLSEVFRREICQGRDEKAVKAKLIEAGVLIPGKDGKPSQTMRLPGIGPGRAYVLRYVSLEN